MWGRAGTCKLATGGRFAGERALLDTMSYHQPYTAQPQYAAPAGQAINVGGRMIPGYTQAQRAVTDATAAVQRWPTLKLEAGLYSAQHPLCPAC